MPLLLPILVILLGEGLSFIVWRFYYSKIAPWNWRLLLGPRVYVKWMRRSTLDELEFLLVKEAAK